MIIGAIHSGKSSYVKFFDTKAMNIEAEGRDKKYYTVGMDLATLQLEGFKVFLFGTPGLLRMQVMRDVISDRADGVIFLLDSAHPESDKDAIEILNSLKKNIPADIPIIFCANKQDEPTARSSEEVKIQNKLPKEAIIFSTSAKTGLNMHESLKFMVNLIFKKFENCIEILRKYQDDVERLAQQLKMDKLELQDFLHDLEIKRFIDIDREKQTFKVKEGLHELK